MQREIDRLKKLAARRPGRKPYGMGGPEQLAAIAAMKLLRAKTGKDGHPRSFRRIAQQLNQHGVPTLTGTPWNPSTVRAVRHGPYWDLVDWTEFAEEVQRICADPKEVQADP